MGGLSNLIPSLNGFEDLGYRLIILGFIAWLIAVGYSKSGKK